MKKIIKGLFMTAVLLASCTKQDTHELTTVNEINSSLEQLGFDDPGPCREINKFKIAFKQNANNIAGSSIEFNYTVKPCDLASFLSLKIVMDDVTTGTIENKFLKLTLDQSGKFAIPTTANHTYRFIMLVYDVNPAQSALLDYARADFTNGSISYDHWIPEVQ